MDQLPLMTSNQEFVLKLPDGLKIAGKRWGPLGSSKKVLALHGWLDNSATWDAIGPLLGDQGYLVVCIDFLGHGKSEHLACTLYTYETHLLTIYQTLMVLGWSSCIFLAHSMGGIISLLFSGALPQMVEKLILVESLGPWTRPGPKPPRMETEILKYPKLLQVTPRVYPTVSAAVDKLMENNPNIDKKSASTIVLRSLLKVAGGFSFSHDPKLLGSSLRWYEEEEIRSYFERINCPILLFWTEKTLQQYEDIRVFSSGKVKNASLAPRGEIIKNDEFQSLKDTLMGRVRYFKQELVHSILLKEGSHHVHLDMPELVFPHLLNFLNPTNGTQSAKL